METATQMLRQQRQVFEVIEEVSLFSCLFWHDSNSSVVQVSGAGKSLGFGLLYYEFLREVHTWKDTQDPYLEELDKELANKDYSNYGAIIY